MNFEFEVLRVHSKEQATLIMEFALEHPERFEDLFDLLFNKDIRVVQRSAWPLGMLGKAKPQWFLPYFDKILTCIENPSHPAVNRNLYRILQFIPTPEEHQGNLFGLCLRDIEDGQAPVAIKAFAMTVAHNIALPYPDLQAELKITIQENSSNQSPGYFSRARKVLKQIG